MKSILHLKFIVLYIIFGFLCVFTTATLTNELIMDRELAWGMLTGVRPTKLVMQKLEAGLDQVQCLF